MTSTLHDLMPCRRKTSLMILLMRFLQVARKTVFFLKIIPSRAFLLALPVKKILNLESAILSAWMTWSKPAVRGSRYPLQNLAFRLNPEPCTALGSARVNDSAPTTCLHPDQETMRPLPLRHRWLKSAFHLRILSMLNSLLQIYPSMLSSQMCFSPCG